MMYRYSTYLVLVILLCNCAQKEEKRLTDFVNPFIGSKAGFGHVTPGACSPFGLVQLCPTNVTDCIQSGGYSYELPYIEGFGFTQMSGVGYYGDLGNFLVMPTNGPLKTFSGRNTTLGRGYRSLHSKNEEKAEAGYYTTFLSDYKIRAELVAAPHSGIMKFTYPKNNQSRIQIDLAHRVGGTSDLQYVKVVNENTIEGWIKCTPECGGWGNGEGKGNYTVYFYTEFSKPLKKFGVWNVKIPDGWNRKSMDFYLWLKVKEDKLTLSNDSLASTAEILDGCREKTGKQLGFYTEFSTEQDEPVMLKSGISFVSIEGAKKNLKAEIKDWDFNKARETAENSWEKALDKITVEGGTIDQRTIFYTALYRTMIDPRAMADIDGKYPGGDGKIYETNTFTKRTIFSGWDVFRSQFPLQNIINPEMVNDMINSLVELADQSGNKYLERWEFLNAYSGCMIGNPAVSVIVDAYNKGIRNFDIAKAYKYSVNTCEKFGNGELGHSYSISNTLEHSYFEWCLAQFADSLQQKADATKYLKRSQSYRNVFDHTLGWFRPRDEKGWLPWPAEGRLKQGYGCEESNPYQQGWFVPHDIEGLAALLGGKEKMISELNAFIEKAPANLKWNDYYNHSNEPVHHVLFMFNRLGAPWLTQKWVRDVCQRAYHNTVEGLVGDEDVGQMSAWYVLAASGIHPVCPGDNRYEICSPVFNKITFRLDPKYANAKSFSITAHNNSEKNTYIQSAKLNGKPYNKSWITHDDVISGSTLELQMGPEPNKQWGNE
jgi:predicted alpha-1,2-mannosidase